MYINNTPINSSLYSVATDSIPDGETFNVIIPDVKATGINATDGSKIRVEYEAALNSNAVIGAAGNPNQVYLEYSNNPNWIAGDTSDKKGETGKTAIDKVIVFTYKVIVNKVTKASESFVPLSGAEFKLLKWDYNKYLDKVALMTVTNDGCTFVWTGLDDGHYFLQEVTAPAGYNKISEIEFVIEAGHVISSDNPTLTSLTGNKEDGTALFTATTSTGVLSCDIENEKGVLLPETGGIGTAVFYIVGAVLIIGAIVFFITKKRFDSKEE